MTTVTPKPFEGAERARKHAALHVFMDLGGCEQSTLDDADVTAAGLARKDPTLLMDRLGSEFGPKLDLPSDGLTSTSGTWCMFAAKRRYPLVLGVARDAGISMDDPKAFLSGGLLSYEAWYQSQTLIDLALSLGASPDARVHRNVHGTHTSRPVVEALWMDLDASHAGKSRNNTLESMKKLLEAGAVAPEPEMLLDSVSRAYGAKTRAVMLTSIMRGELVRARNASGPIPGLITPPAPARARIRI